MQDLQILSFDTLSSTNTRAGIEIAAGRCLPFAVRAAYQSGGKGRQGRGWHSENGKNLLITFALKTDFVKPEAQFIISKAFAVSLCETLSECAGMQLTIKWPNDIYADRRKLAGILIEHSISGNKINYSILGAGININQEIFPNSIPNPVSLKMINGQLHSIEYVQEKFIEKLSASFEMLRSGHTVTFDAYFLNHLWQHGVYAPYILNGKEMQLKITGTDAYGRLLLVDKQGLTHCCAMNEISYII